VSVPADALGPALVLWYAASASSRLRANGSGSGAADAQSSPATNADAKGTIQLSLGSEIGRIERELPILN
jgi:hypothetical protein